VAQAANPCAAKAADPCSAKAKNPCVVKAANPCAAKNPCAASDRIDSKLVTRPAGTRLFAGASAQLVKEGKRLWNDRSLGTSGLACGTCHLNHANFNPSFVKPFPHAVAMTEQRARLKQVSLDEMVQFCMVVPMASKPLAWDSKELAALTAYAGEVQKGFIKAAAANPCMLKPSAANPCNPCAAKNPCAGKR
jgi:cytochrome c